jgi:hypothetical protein
MTSKSSELEGKKLDAAVALALGHGPGLVRKWLADELEGHWSPSTDWSKGGPIIEAERISLTERGDHWFADGRGYSEVGPTALVAAMRAFVSGKLGDQVDL